MKKQDTLGIYVHFPFCLQKCRYCDFCSYPGRSEREMYAYTEALCREIRAQADEHRGRTVDTLFFGGGTPTCLPTDALLRVADTLKECYCVAADAEWTTEANPATLTADKAGALRAAGLNRISIGMQSAQDSELALLGRVHRASDLAEAVAAVRAGGFTDINLDLMFGIPQQTGESFARTLDAALALAPTHLSVYSLQIEEGTPFYAEQDALVLPDEDEEDGMYADLLQKTRAAGLLQYEISNYATAGRECRHNLRYWQRRDYLGFGPSAHASVGRVRSFNPPDLAAYLENPCGVRETEEILSDAAAEYEAIMLGLRTAHGIEEAAFAAEFGEGFYARYRAPLARFAAAGLVRFENGCTSLSATGMRLSNAVITEILASREGAHLIP